MRMQNPGLELRSRFYVRARREACTYWIEIRKRLATQPWRRRSSKSLPRFCILMAERACFSEQGSPGPRAVTPRLRLPHRTSGAPGKRCVTAAKSRSPSFITRPRALQQFGNCCCISSRGRKRLAPRNHRAPGDPALRSFTGNSFGSLPAAGLSEDVTWPSTSRPSGTPTGPEELTTNDCPLVQTREVCRRQLRPVVSSDRRRAVEIPVVRSARKVLRVIFSDRPGEFRLATTRECCP